MILEGEINSLKKEIINYTNLVENMIEKALGNNDKRLGIIKCWQKNIQSLIF